MTLSNICDICRFRCIHCNNELFCYCSYSIILRFLTSKITVYSEEIETRTVNIGIPSKVETNKDKLTFNLSRSVDISCIRNIEEVVVIQLCGLWPCSQHQIKNSGLRTFFVELDNEKPSNQMVCHQSLYEQPRDRNCFSF